MRIAIAGGTGTVGRYAVTAAEQRGDEVVVLSRSSGVDVRAGTGLSEALAGIDVVLDTTNTSTTKKGPATAFFTAVAANLQRAAAERGVGFVVSLSIVGIDRTAGYGYYAAKLAHEKAAREGSVPATILRATQFHEFPGQLLRRTRRGPVAFLPVMRVQSVAARSVGERLVELAHEGPQQAVQELAGPDSANLVDLGRRLIEHRGERTRVVPLMLPGSASKAMRHGALLPRPGAQLVGPSFDDWLTSPDSDA
jgi:uncharacterized protein YbjT (DUF2867 family)